MVISLVTLHARGNKMGFIVLVRQLQIWLHRRGLKKLIPPLCTFGFSDRDGCAEGRYYVSDAWQKRRKKYIQKDDDNQLRLAKIASLLWLQNCNLVLSGGEAGLAQLKWGIINSLAPNKLSSLHKAFSSCTLRVILLNEECASFPLAKRVTRKPELSADALDRWVAKGITDAPLVMPEKSRGTIFFPSVLP